MKRIGVFQYKWPLQVHTINLAIKLSESGFQVDLYLYRCDTSFVSLSTLASYPNVKIFHITNWSQGAGIVGRVVRNSRRICGLPILKPINLTEVVKKTLKYMRSSKYDFFIGIEKNGMIWAGMLSEKLDVPHLYYSLEIDSDGYSDLEAFGSSDAIFREEKKYHARAVGTIIQDKLRAKVLFQNNGVEQKNTIYIPVSLSGKKIEETSRFLHAKLGIEFSKKIIIYIGWVCKKRWVDELAQSVAGLSEDFVLVFHGPLGPDISAENTYGRKVFFSKDMISSEDISKLVTSAYIGVAYYGDATVNDKLTAFASEKIASYMQCGLPVIAHWNESYELLMEQHHCGELLEHIYQLPEAVQKIDANYADYRRNAFAAFEHFYSFDNNIHALTKFLFYNLRESNKQSSISPEKVVDWN